MKKIKLNAKLFLKKETLSKLQANEINGGGPFFRRWFIKRWASIGRYELECASEQERCIV